MTRARSILAAALGLCALLSACDESGSLGAGSDGGAGSRSAPTGSESSASEGSSSGSGALAPTLQFVAQFNALNNELPEGLAITPDGQTAYVGYAVTGQIVKVSLPDGKVTAFGGLAPPIVSTRQLLGLILDTRGDLFAAVTGVPKLGAGIYKIDKNSGAATLFVDDLKMGYPNSFGFLSDGSLLVTDSIVGIIFRIDLKTQTISNWLVDPLLLGDPSPLTNKCAEGLPPFPLGTNGIVSVGDKVYVAHTDGAKIIQIPINGDGTAGKPVEFFKSDMMTCAPLKGANGLTADDHGNIFIVGSLANTVVRVGQDGKAETLIDNDGKLDFPTSIVLSTVLGRRYAFITNRASSAAPKPGLLSYGPLP